MCTFGGIACLVATPLIYKNSETKQLTGYITGGLLTVLGLPNLLSCGKHLQKSITIYNNKNTTANSNYMQLQFGISASNVTVVLRF
jgi:hypothetical protein